MMFECDAMRIELSEAKTYHHYDYLLAKKNHTTIHFHHSTWLREVIPSCQEPAHLYHPIADMTCHFSKYGRFVDNLGLLLFLILCSLVTPFRRFSEGSFRR